MLFSAVVSSTLLVGAAAMPALQKRQGTFDENGNLKLTFSKSTVLLGDLEMDKIFASIGEACHETGLCESNEISLDSQLFGSDTVEGLTVKLGPQGAYPTWIRNGLLDALKAAVLEVAVCEDTKHTQSCGFSSTYCPNSGTKTYTQCEVPAYWGINYQVPEEANASPPWLSLDLTVEKAGGGEICESVLAGAGGAASIGSVGNAVSGVASGIFALLSLTCE